MGSALERVFHILVHCFADPVQKKEVNGLHFDVLVLPLLYDISFFNRKMNAVLKIFRASIKNERHTKR